MINQAQAAFEIDDEFRSQPGRGIAFPDKVFARNPLSIADRHWLSRQAIRQALKKSISSCGSRRFENKITMTITRSKILGETMLD